MDLAGPAVAEAALVSTAPRRALKGTTHLVTRRTLNREFLLGDEGISEVFRYLLALLSARYAIELHSYCLLSNHYHLLLTDTQGVLSHFMRDLNSNLTRAVNKIQRRVGRVWDERGFHNREIYGEEAVWDRLVYTITNPVHHGLVESPEAWPSALSLPVMIGQTGVLERPAVLGHSSLPPSVTLTLTAPPVLRYLPAETFRDRLRGFLSQAVQSILEARGRTASFGTQAHVEDQRPTPPDTSKRTQGRVIACADNATWRELVADYLAWREAYDRAREAWPTDKEILFPPGTFGLRVFHGAKVAPP